MRSDFHIISHEMSDDTNLGRVLFLNYHSIDVGRSDRGYHVDPVYSVKRDAFEAQLAAIAAAKVPVLSLPEYLAQRRQRVPFTHDALVITFDDGFRTDYEVAYPLLARFGFSATFFVCLSNLGEESRWAQMRDMIAAGFTIGSHTLTHRYLTDLDRGELDHELSASRRIIEQRTGQPVRYLAPPGGRYDRSIIERAEHFGYRALLTTRVGANDHTSDAMALKRWTVRAQTSPAEFERMIVQDPSELRKKQLRSRALDFGKRLLGDHAFDQLRSALLAARP